MQFAGQPLGLDGFTGNLPLFPLPGVVLFPCTLLPLHIFEPRYRAMVGDAFARDGCIGIVLLRPGWEQDYYGNPPIHEIACLGKMIETTRLADGRYDIVLCGVRRARVEAIVSDRPYRTARVEVLEDRAHSARSAEAAALRRRLLEIATGLPQRFFRHKNLGRALRKLEAPLGCTADLLADSLLLDPETKQGLLSELDPIARAESLLRAVDIEIRAQEPLLIGARRFPRPSEN